jgi:hypothetical protein
LEGRQKQNKKATLVEHKDSTSWNWATAATTGHEYYNSNNNSNNSNRSAPGVLVPLTGKVPLSKRWDGYIYYRLVDCRQKQPMPPAKKREPTSGTTTNAVNRQQWNVATLPAVPRYYQHGQQTNTSLYGDRTGRALRGPSSAQPARFHFGRQDAHAELTKVSIFVRRHRYGAHGGGVRTTSS